MVAPDSLHSRPQRAEELVPPEFAVVALLLVEEVPWLVQAAAVAAAEQEPELDKTEALVAPRHRRRMDLDYPVVASEKWWVKSQRVRRIERRPWARES